MYHPLSMPKTTVRFTLVAGQPLRETFTAPPRARSSEMRQLHSGRIAAEAPFWDMRASCFLR